TFAVFARLFLRWFLFRSFFKRDFFFWRRSLFYRFRLFLFCLLFSFLGRRDFLRRLFWRCFGTRRSYQFCSQIVAADFFASHQIHSINWVAGSTPLWQERHHEKGQNQSTVKQKREKEPLRKPIFAINEAKRSFL